MMKSLNAESFNKLSKKEKEMVLIVDSLHGAVIDAQMSIEYYNHCVRQEKSLAKKSTDCKVTATKRAQTIDELNYVRHRLKEFQSDNPTFRPDAPHITQVLLLTLANFPKRYESNRPMHRDRYQSPSVWKKIFRWVKGLIYGPSI